ncbi:MAG: helix-turn-helix transcriptional regulator [Lachnospiraceae bacterium]|nr:helix-turn-helix transcriptional regulator [Lachnospiraceae bacterium]
MNLACELLRHTDLSTEKIAGETGYENISSFHRAFQKNVGMTPAKFRKKLKSGLGQRGFQNIKNTLC